MQRHGRIEAIPVIRPKTRLHPRKASASLGDGRIGNAPELPFIAKAIKAA
jgi:hypothetical protein